MGKKKPQMELTAAPAIWGRDEMNLAEFPLALVASRAPRDCKTLTFEDRTWDRGRQQHVNRKLTISGCDRYGLPTALDDEVILGLIQLTKLDGVKRRRVPFTRYQLIRLLDWRDEGKSYRRLDTSLNRWVGVTLYYDNAWWCRETKCWASECFHLLDNVVLRTGRSRQDGGPLSSFTWNDVIFRSLTAGNMRRLNMTLYRELKSSIAKRIYRYIDKHFYFSSTLKLNLQRFAFEHIGLSRSYDVAQIKRRLQPAIEELETVGELKPMSKDERFRRPTAGNWQVVFEAAAKPSGKAPKAVAPRRRNKPDIGTRIVRRPDEQNTPSLHRDLVGPLPLFRGGLAVEFASAAGRTQGSDRVACRQDLDPSGERARSPVRRRNDRAMVLQGQT